MVNRVRVRLVLSITLNYVWKHTLTTSRQARKVCVCVCVFTGTVCVDRPHQQAPKALLVMVNSEVTELGHDPHGAVILDPQVRCMLQWAAASMAQLPQVQLGTDREVQQVSGAHL